MGRQIPCPNRWGDECVVAVSCPSHYRRPSSSYLSLGQRLHDAYSLMSFPFSALMSDRRLNKLNPLASPKPLFNVSDFVRRTYLEYLIPIFPADAPYKVLEIANPFMFDYPDDSTGVFADGFTTDMTYLENEAKWPEWT